MKPRFIIHHNNHVSIYCEVLDRDKQNVHGRVINGAWDFNLDIESGRMVYAAPSGVQHMDHCKVMWLPFDRGNRHYKDVIPWAGERLMLNPAHRWFLERGDAIDYHTHEFRTKWRRASRAFLDAWRGKRSVWTDDLPF